MSEMLGQIVDGKYRIVDKVGSGGFADVYRAEHRVLRSYVAIKVLQPQWRAHRSCLQRFIQEARLCAAVGHPSIVGVHDLGYLDDGTPYLVLDFVDGDTLRSHMRTGPVAPGLAIPWILDVLDGLSAAHARGVVHGDLKPGNILIEGDGDESRAVLVDFGAASPSGRAPDGVVWGTPHYMAPELTRGEAATPAADVYAMGVLLRELLQGSAHSPAPGAACSLADDRLEPLHRIAERASSHDPRRRHRDAADLRADLLAAQGELPPLVQDRGSGPSASADFDGPTQGFEPFGLMETEDFLLPSLPVVTRRLGPQTAALAAAACG